MRHSRYYRRSRSNVELVVDRKVGLNVKKYKLAIDTLSRARSSDRHITKPLAWFGQNSKD
ncbi:hypothetical protein [Scytonema millei]|uniref:Uncharacterized protein n=1 Tax=Scytonema millei VB511283 TaxID=1245923 RepID=A0A9X5E970_9CYAN|nr:hypothetical protein [Scytonema millei]NHC37098.1 hypothetical protein [Scytonema millei VB511283]